MKKRMCAFLLAICIFSGLMLQLPVTAAAAEINLPEAEIDHMCNLDIGEVILQFGMTFTAPEGESDYDDWIVDYELTFSEDVYGRDGILAGRYKNYNNGDWVAFKPSKSDPFYDELLFPANTPVRIIRTFSEPIFGIPNAEMNYELIRKFVGTFDCGLTLNPEFWDVHPNTTVQLALKMYEPSSQPGQPGKGHVVGDVYVYEDGATEPHICKMSNWFKNEKGHHKTQCGIPGCPLKLNTAPINEGFHTFGADDFCTTCGYLRDVEKTAAPETGDTTNTLLWTSLFFGGVAMMWMQLNTRKREMF